MKTETFTSPSPELKQHVQDLHHDANLVVQDVKNQADDDFQEIKTEANTRLQEARGIASSLYDLLKSFTAEYPLSVFAAGLITGVVLAAWRRK